MTLKDIIGEPISYEDAISILKSNDLTYHKFLSFDVKHQEDIIAFIQGNKGLPILYDDFFKYVLDPERHPERLEDFLSEIFGQEVKIEEVLAREGNKLAEEGTLVVMDIIVRLSDGTIVDVEMQKIGYSFTGERSSCYISDMIMRQYNRVKAKEQKNFKFNQMKPVYLVVILEKSTKEFQQVAPNFMHRLQNSFDSGVHVNLLSNIVYISLDTFGKVRDNICNKLVAWLIFLSSDNPDDILQLVTQYPEFKECYHDIMKFRTKPEELIHMFSDALIQMDKNTVQYMIEEQQKEIEEQQKEIEEQEKELEQQREELAENKKELEENKKELEENKKELEENKKELEENKKELEESQKELRENKKKLVTLEQEYAEMKRLLEQYQSANNA